MPLKRLEYTFNYCKSNIPSFILVLILILFLNVLQKKNPDTMNGFIVWMALIFVLTSITYGYGLSVSKNIINNGSSLPKLEFYKSFILGVKSTIITLIYTAIQIGIFMSVAIIFDFPFISIHEGEIHLENVGSLFYSHNSLETILFAIFVVGMMYITTFFLEIALARLADKGDLSSALNMVSIKECIDLIGWTHYASDYTKLIISIAILAYVKYGIDLMMFGNWIIDLTIGLLIFIIQYIGIGMIYKEYKEKKYGVQK